MGRRPGGGDANRSSLTRGPPLARPVLTARGKKSGIVIQALSSQHLGELRGDQRRTGDARDPNGAGRGGTEPKRAAEVAVATANGCVITVMRPEKAVAVTAGLSSPLLSVVREKAPVSPLWSDSSPMMSHFPPLSAFVLSLIARLGRRCDSGAGGVGRSRQTGAGMGQVALHFPSGPHLNRR